MLDAHHNGAPILRVCKVGLIAIFEFAGGPHDINPNRGGCSDGFVRAVHNTDSEVVGAAENIVELPGSRPLWCAPGFAVNLQLQTVTGFQGARGYLRTDRKVAWSHRDCCLIGG